MASLTSARAIPPNDRTSLAEFLEQALDEMQVIDRAYHHLSLSIPLSAAILERVRRTHPEPGARVLMIGGTSLLAYALGLLGYEVQVWRLADSYVADEVLGMVGREVSAPSLSSGEPLAPDFNVILAPLLQEGLTTSPQEFYAGLKAGLRAGGRLIIAARNQSRLYNRVAAARGRPVSQNGNPGMSMAWPFMPAVREYHCEEIVNAVTAAGFHVKHAEYVVGSKVLFGLEPVRLKTYGAKKGAQVLRRVMPSVRDTILVEAGRRITEEPGESVTARLDASVIVSAGHSPERLEMTLADLQAQLHPRERWELIVIRGERDCQAAAAIEAVRQEGCLRVRELVADPPEGPTSRNRAMEMSEGEFCAHLDDLTRVRPDWLQTALLRVGKDKAVIGGPIFAEDGSEPRYFDTPGLRSDRLNRKPEGEYLFPVGNLILRRRPALAAGGFRDLNYAWDTDLVWRLGQAGWGAEFREDVSAHRYYPPPTDGLLRGQLKKAGGLAGVYANVPGLGGRLTLGLFASRATMYFDVALVAGLAAVLTGRLWLLAGTLPWLRTVAARLHFWPPRAWPASAKLAAKLGALHSVWLAGCLRGSIRSRRPVL